MSGVPDGGGARIQPRLGVVLGAGDRRLRAPASASSSARARCQLPFPSNWFTEADASSHTGRRVHFGAETWTPAAGQRAGDRPDRVEPQRRLLARLRDRRARARGRPRARPAPHRSPTSRSRCDPTSRSSLLDATTGERWPFFAELDANATSDATALAHHPARPQLPGRSPHRRRARAASSGPTAASSPRAARSRSTGTSIPTFIPQVEQRRADDERRRSARSRARGSTAAALYLAWDFTVASDENLTERSLHIRDDAFASLGSGARRRSPSTNVAGRRQHHDLAPGHRHRRRSRST